MDGWMDTGTISLQDVVRHRISYTFYTQTDNWDKMEAGEKWIGGVEERGMEGDEGGENKHTNSKINKEI